MEDSPPYGIQPIYHSRCGKCGQKSTQAAGATCSRCFYVLQPLPPPVPAPLLAVSLVARFEWPTPAESLADEVTRRKMDAAVAKMAGDLQPHVAGIIQTMVNAKSGAVRFRNITDREFYAVSPE